MLNIARKTHVAKHSLGKVKLKSMQLAVCFVAVCDLWGIPWVFHWFYSCYVLHFKMYCIQATCCRSDVLL